MEDIVGIFDQWYNPEENTLNLPQEWATIAKEIGLDFFLDLLSEWISLRGIGLPCTGITLEEAVLDFQKLIETDHKLEAKSWVHSAGKNQLKHHGLVIAGWKDGNQASRFFNTRYRLATGGRRGNGLSVLDMWSDPKLRRSALRILKLESRYNRKISSGYLLNLLANQGCSTSYFRPSAAKAVYQRYGARDVFDFSCGWGDRLIAALASPHVKKYWGTDPNKENQVLYKRIVKTLGPVSSKPTNVVIFTDPAEDVLENQRGDLKVESFDLVFTSCPYFDTERYAENTNHQHLQSWYRYKTLHEWIEGFLFEAINMSVAILRKGGFLCLNIADGLSKGGHTDIISPLMKYCASLHELAFVECLGYQLKGRYGTDRLKSSIHCEPILVWRKVK